jgi:hypothetical protein
VWRITAVIPAIKESIMKGLAILKQNHPQPFPLWFNPGPAPQAPIRLNLLRLREFYRLINPTGADSLSIRPVSCEFKIPGGLHGIHFRRIRPPEQALPLLKFRYRP